MIFISHRGNLTGPNPELENKPDSIEYAIANGFDVEIDVWYREGDFWLGHDVPVDKVGDWWLLKHAKNLWIHCKDAEAVWAMRHLNTGGFVKFNGKFNYFWHQTDDMVITSKEYIWVYPDKQPVRSSIAVLPEQVAEDDNLFDVETIKMCNGVCSDYIYEIRKQLGK
jgi:hypothetical protein